MALSLTRMVALSLVIACASLSLPACSESTPPQAESASALIDVASIDRKSAYDILLTSAGERPEAVAEAISGETGIMVERVRALMASLPMSVLDQCPGTKARRIVQAPQDAGGRVHLTRQPMTDEARRQLLERDG